MVRFIIVRHGCSVTNSSSRFAGQRDVSLDEVGAKQAKVVSKYLLENFCFDKIYSSDLSRAINTIAPVAEALGMDIEQVVGLRELNVGEWEGKTASEVEKLYPESFAIYKSNVGRFCPEGGGSYAELVERSKSVLDSLALENEGKTVLVATHGTFIRCLYCAISGAGLDDIKNIPHVANASISILDYVDGEGKFVEYGSSSHLDGMITEFKVV